jgi:hypothetical protein
MALSKLVFKPGVNRDQTNYSSEGGWYDCDKIRFRSGYPEKIGGWTVVSASPFSGVCRSLLPYSVSNFSQLIGIGTNAKVYVQSGAILNDITPLRSTRTSPDTNNCFTTSLLSNVVTVTISGHNAQTGNYVTFSGVVGPIGGIPASEFNTSKQITVVDANTFTIQTTTNATSAATGGGTSITALFDIYSGNEAPTAGYGWGAGSWGRGAWGSSATTPVYSPARIIFQDKLFDTLYFNVRDASGSELTGTPGTNIFYWNYDSSFSQRGQPLTSLLGAIAVPRQVGQILFASSSYMLALGCTDYDPGQPATDYNGSYNPLLIRWCDTDLPQVWEQTVSNNAGSYIIQTGSRIFCGYKFGQETLVFTDSSLSSLQLINSEFVFDVQEKSNNISIMGPNAVTAANNICYWMGVDKFFVYSGRVDTLPCTLRQYVFQDVNQNLAPIFFAGTNPQFNEVIWFYASANATEIDRYVIFNYLEKIWYFGQLERTAWTDSGWAVNPIAAGDSWIYQHESGKDDGQPLGLPSLPINSYIKSADIDIGNENGGEKFMQIRRIIPDVNFTNSNTVDPVTSQPLTPSAYIQVGVRNFPGAASNPNPNLDVVTSTATIDQYTNQVFIRARGRQMNFQIGSTGLGVQWQIGMPRVDLKEDGRR